MKPFKEALDIVKAIKGGKSVPTGDSAKLMIDWRPVAWAVDMNDAGNAVAVQKKGDITISVTVMEGKANVKGALQYLKSGLKRQKGRFNKHLAMSSYTSFPSDSNIASFIIYTEVSGVRKQRNSLRQFYDANGLSFDKLQGV